MERTASCPSCGRGVFDGDAFCSWCGTPIQARSADTGKSRQTLARQTIPTGERETCASCNSPVLPGDVFCSTCGARHGVDPTEGAFGESWTGIPQRITEASRGKYELIRELGRGGMGIVFMARDRELERLVAIKVLSPSLLADEDMVRRFQREARTIASLRHESIISVYDVGRAGDLHFFVMDFIEGVSLSRILRTFGPLPIPVVQAILYQVGAALSYAHRPGRGVVHRDVKPSNIMLDHDGLAVVMDFGISKVSESSSGLTRTGLVIGTPEYMSPEQCRGHTVTEASDQYSLGAVVFATLTGAPPFTGPFYRVLMAHQTEPVPSVLELRPDCPPEFAEATERMLGKAPGDRWPGIREALKSLGLRPLAHDDPALRQLADLVAETVERDRKKEGRAGAEDDERDEGGVRTPTSIRIVPVPGDLEIGDELGLRASALFPDGVEEMGLDVSWESTDPAIVRVDASTGQLQAVGVGSALVRAVGAGLSESVAVEVKRPQVVRVVIEPRAVEVEVASTVRLAAEARNKRDDPLERAVSWSSSDPRTASVSGEGVVTGRKEGSASILAHSEGVGAAATVRVTAAEAAATAPAAGGAGTIARIDVSSPPGELRVAQTFRLTAIPLDAGERPVEAPVRWTVEDPSVLEEMGDGRFRAVGPGDGTLLAEAGSARTRVHVSVVGTRPSEPAGATAWPPPGDAPAPPWERTPDPLAPPSTPPPARSPLPESGGGRADEVARDGARTPRSGPDRRPPAPAAAGPLRSSMMLWAGVAAVLGAGGIWLGSGLFGGGGEPAVAEVTILDGGAPVSPDLQLAVGERLTLSATPADAEGTALDRTVEWSSSDPAVASVGPDGLLVARAGGTALITATAEGVVRDVPVTVSVAPAEIVVRTAADGEPVAGDLPLEVGGTLDLDADVLDSNGDAVPDAAVDWTASPSSVATVDPRGVVSGRAGGEARVRAAGGGLQAEVTVSVAERPSPPPTPREDPGTLFVQVSPWAYLHVDGVQRGQDGSTHQLSLPPGRYALRLTNTVPNMMPLDTTVTVRSGQTTRLQLIMRERNEG